MARLIADFLLRVEEFNASHRTFGLAAVASEDVEHIIETAATVPVSDISERRSCGPLHRPDCVPLHSCADQVQMSVLEVDQA